MTNLDIKTAIQAEMRAAFPAAEQRVERFYAMQEYHLGWRDSRLAPAAADPGKLLRPQLALLSCRAVGGDIGQALPLAAGIQLIHDFSLIHDDIEDQSDTRRGRITVWKQWGLAHGINAGDGMFVVAHLALHRMAAQGVPAERALRILERFDRTILTICEGQYLDLSFEGDLTINEADYLAMIGRKTAALIAGAAAMGSMVGGGDDAAVTAMDALGEQLGLAFQIEDDILGIWGEPERTGKPRAADIYRRKVSLPVVYALRQSVDSAELADLYSRSEISDAMAQRVLAILDSCRAREFCAQTAGGYHRAVAAALGRISPASDDAARAVAQLREITAMLSGRQS
jgi:geranylgeranyl diphosphate synthase, type I